MKNFTLFLSALTSKDATVRKVEEKWLWFQRLYNKEKTELYGDRDEKWGQEWERCLITYAEKESKESKFVEGITVRKMKGREILNC